MKYSRLALLKTMAAVLICFTARVHAGVLLPKTGEAQVGDLKASQNTIVLSISHGSMTFRKEDLLWYIEDPAINTFFKATSKAIADGKSSVIVRKLLEASIQNEPSMRVEAQNMLSQRLRDEVQKLEVKAAENSLREPLTLGSPEAGVKTFVQTPNVNLKLTLDHVDFAGFVSYNTYVVSGGKLFTFPIQQPIFSKMHLDTTVTVGTGDQPSIIRVNQ